MRARAGLHNGVQQQRDKNGMLCRVRKIFFSYFFTFTFLFVNSFILNFSTTAMMIDDSAVRVKMECSVWRGFFFTNCLSTFLTSIPLLSERFQFCFSNSNDDWCSQKRREKNGQVSQAMAQSYSIHITFFHRRVGGMEKRTIRVICCSTGILSNTQKNISQNNISP